MSNTAANSPNIGQVPPISGLPNKAGVLPNALGAERLLGGVSFSELAAISLSRNAGISLVLDGTSLANRQIGASRGDGPADNPPPLDDEHAALGAASISEEESVTPEGAAPILPAPGPEYPTPEAAPKGPEPRQGEIDTPRLSPRQDPSIASKPPAELPAASTDRPTPIERPIPTPAATLKAHVTDAPQDLQPKSAAPLNGRTAIAAQAAAEKSPSTTSPDGNGGTRSTPNVPIGTQTLARHAHGGNAANGNLSRGRLNGVNGKAPNQITPTNVSTAAQATAEAVQARNALPPTSGRSSLAGPRLLPTVLPEQSALGGGSLAGSHASQRAVEVSPAFKPRPAMPPRVVTNQVSVQIQKAVAQGTDRITIQLKPAELGRVDVRLDIGLEGRVAATISTDRPETLELLQRDARTLQNALHDAGLRTDSDSLNFQLRGHSNAMDGEQDGENAGGDAESDSTEDNPVETALRAGHVADDRVDIEV